MEEISNKLSIKISFCRIGGGIFTNLKGTTM